LKEIGFSLIQEGTTGCKRESGVVQKSEGLTLWWNERFSLREYKVTTQSIPYHALAHSAAVFLPNAKKPEKQTSDNIFY